jgi:cytoskeletal protein CcmA (bactofilin family)
MTKKKDTAINTILGEGIIVTGNIQLKGNIIIYGKVAGDISTDGAITVSTTARIHGQLNGENLNIGGKVEGNVVAKSKVVLGEMALLKGDISASQIVIEDGARFEGSCFMNLSDIKK